jgi:DNA-binding MarR family transcriptional regulator
MIMEKQGRSAGSRSTGAHRGTARGSAAKREAIHAAIAGLQRVTDLFRERRRQLAGEAGLTETEWRVLEEIAGEDFMPSMFARSRDCTPAAVSRTLRSLLDAGLVSAAISGADARQRVYRLTAPGRRTIARLRASRAAAIAAIWKQFSARELENFAHFTEELAEGLSSYASRAAD